MFRICCGLFGFIENLSKVPKPIALTLLVLCLAVRGKSLGDSGQTETIGITRCLVARVVLSGDYYQTMALFFPSACRQEGCARRCSLAFRLAAPDDNTESSVLFWLHFSCL